MQDDSDESDIFRPNISQEELEDMMYTLEKDHQEALKLKKENKILRKKLEGVIQNNQKMAEIISKLDKKMHGSDIQPRNKLIYSYQEKGMVDKNLDKKGIMELRKKHVTIKQINQQLNELVSMMEKKKD